MRPSQMFYGERRIMLGHCERSMTHLSLNVKRTTPHCQLRCRHIPAALVMIREILLPNLPPLSPVLFFYHLSSQRSKSKR